MFVRNLLNSIQSTRARPRSGFLPCSVIGGTLQHFRCICSKNERDGDGDDDDDVFSPDDTFLNGGEIYKQIFLGPDSKPIFEYDNTQPPDENYDWSAFEKAFGLDKLHNTDLEEWEPQLSSNDDCSWDIIEMDGSEESINEASRIMANFHVRHAMNGNGRTDPETERPADNMKDGGQLDDIIPHALTKPQNSLLPADTVPSKDSEALLSHDKPMDQVTRRYSFPEDGPTKKKGRIQRNSKRISKRVGMQVVPSHPEQQSGRVVPKAAVDSINIAHSLRVPRNNEKPGYERRIRGLEVQMERIATEVLCVPGHEFHDVGATMHYVLLSPDGFSLSIYFDLDDASAEFRKTNISAWSSRMGSQVRAELSQRLYTKRVPVVKLIKLKDGTDSVNNNSRDGESIKRQELDMLFDRIKAEREKPSSG